MILSVGRYLALRPNSIATLNGALSRRWSTVTSPGTTATRITVLRLGRSVGVYERATTTQQEVVQAITAGVVATVPGMVAVPEDEEPA